ncbi:MAG: zinc-binding alcohol dehydrogenase [Alphaproteobacteria bacterium]|nr:zinc-binding alcohol dehydrogenase [Alphaproteobacteria bacterium]|tara:strand:- start:674 stop:1687 length:1014 start_codon:yes stop_codon:yes gene_type:complete
MKTASYTRHGPASEVLEIGLLPDPVPGAGEVLVRVVTSGVNPSDVKARAGYLWPMTAPRTIPHSDGAGVIEAVGDGVDPARVGERVWTYNVNRTENGLGQGAIGTAAELVAVRQSLAVPLPDGIDFVAAAALGVPAMTAYAALLSDGPVDGMTVLVTGGAGAVGSLAIQIAKWAGATNIVTTISSDAKAAAAMTDGANATVNYRELGTGNVLGEALLAANDGRLFDRLVDVDFGTYVNLAAGLLHHGGVIGTYASMSEPKPTVDFYPLMMNNITIRLVEIYAQSPARFTDITAGVNRILADGALTPQIDSTFALADLVAAHERVETGQQLGNVIVEI